MLRNKHNNYGKTGNTSFYIIAYIPEGHKTYRAILAGNSLKKANQMYNKFFEKGLRAIVYKLDTLSGEIKFG